MRDKDGLLQRFICNVNEILVPTFLLLRDYYKTSSIDFDSIPASRLVAADNMKGLCRPNNIVLA